MTYNELFNSLPHSWGGAHCGPAQVHGSFGRPDVIVGAAKAPGAERPSTVQYDLSRVGRGFQAEVPALVREFAVEATLCETPGRVPYMRIYLSRSLGAPA